MVLTGAQGGERSEIKKHFVQGLTYTKCSFFKGPLSFSINL